MKECKLTQYQLVYNHLRDIGKITPLDAYREYGIMRLAAIIHKMRQNGFAIVTGTRTRKNRYNNFVTFAVYKWE